MDYTFFYWIATKKLALIVDLFKVLFRVFIPRFYSEIIPRFFTEIFFSLRFFYRDYSSIKFKKTTRPKAVFQRGVKPLKNLRDRLRPPTRLYPLFALQRCSTIQVFHHHHQLCISGSSTRSSETVSLAWACTKKGHAMIVVVKFCLVFNSVRVSSSKVFIIFRSSLNFIKLIL